VLLKEFGVMNQFEIAIGQEKIVCDICGGVMHPMYGCGWDYDRIICAERDCGAEIVYPTTTELSVEYYETNGDELCK
jgi:hypothetical protein